MTHFQMKESGTYSFFHLYTYLKISNPPSLLPSLPPCFLSPSLPRRGSKWPPCVHTLVSSGCHNQTPQTGGLKQQKLTFSQFWRLGGGLRSRFCQGPVVVRALFLAADGHLLTVSSHGREREGFLSSSSYKATVLSD